MSAGSICSSAGCGSWNELVALRLATVVEEPPAEMPRTPDPWQSRPSEGLRDLYAGEPATARPTASLPPKAEAPPRRKPEFDFSTLLGARALAATGAVVTLLGIVFFFALAVERGWIGPAARVSLGAG
jgi:uncharacterized membrane protein